MPVIIGGLAAMIPLLTGEIDLSVAANISLANIFLAGLTTNDHFATPAAVVLAILVSTAVGAVNGLIVVKLQVTSFVATLGMATLIGGVGLAYSNSTDILTVPSSVTTMVRYQLIGLPLSVFYGVAAMLVVATVLRYLPVGRKLRAVGANPRAAALTGIRPGLYRIASFTLGGTLAGIAGVVITGQLGTATAAGTADALLLPIFAAVFLGSTAFTPGRPNVLGLFVAALFLAFVSSGLVLLGASLVGLSADQRRRADPRRRLLHVGRAHAGPPVPRPAAQATGCRGCQGLWWFRLKIIIPNVRWRLPTPWVRGWGRALGSFTPRAGTARGLSLNRSNHYPWKAT